MSWPSDEVHVHLCGRHGKGGGGGGDGCVYVLVCYPLVLKVQGSSCYFPSSQETSKGPHTPPEEDWIPRQPHTPQDSPPPTPTGGRVSVAPATSLYSSDLRGRGRLHVVTRPYSHHLVCLFDVCMGLNVVTS